MIAFACPRCAKPFQLKPEFAGRATRCSSCQEPLVVPPASRDATVPKPSDRIAFACTTCAMKFSVPQACAGRATKCPACNAPLVVPSIQPTGAAAPAAGQIHGAPSSLARLGVDAGVSLTADSGSTSDHTALANVLNGKANDGARYVVESEIARGGMGAVMRAVDCDIRREVAVKYLLDQADAGKKLRFVEEAQITGQLEHPNIVPIHELGVDAQQRIFFSMKMVKGRSLAQILTALRDEPQSAEKEYSLGKLLGIFTNICNALAYAHARSVVHRDLKPANIMVGDFGEVYVMDWGLAKVLKRSTAAPVLAVPIARHADTAASPFDFAATAPLAAPVEPAASSSGASQVVTSRELDADLTEDGAVLGTPVYMPPEQAAGHLADIDERSDVYSMGAILYELLTLQPPISKEGGYWPILLRVTQGQIAPPEQKAPERTRAGKVPAELAAVAMKALAKRKEDRYPSVTLLRQDVERFMEGRSVSAKPDSVREMAVKLVKRNRGASIASAAAAVVLSVVVVWSMVAVLRANARALAEEVAKREQAKRSVPAMTRAARMLIQERQFDDAMTHVDAVLAIDENAADARLLRAQLLLAQQDYPAARAELEACLRLEPDRVEAKKLLDLTQKEARKVQTHGAEALLGLVDELNRQKAFAVADAVMHHVEKQAKSRKGFLETYRKRIEAAWPGLGGSLTFDAAGALQLNIEGADVSDLGPLQGLPLNHLRLSNCAKVRDLRPLKGMPLIGLNIEDCPVADWAPLKDLPLESLRLMRCGSLGDLTPLKGMPLANLTLGRCPISDLTLLKGMPLTTLELSECSRISDLTPLKDLPLKSLSFHACNSLSDLTPLKGMPLTQLTIRVCPISDLTPLKGMPLTKLDMVALPISDLTPLKGMPLIGLSLQNCTAISDLTPLKGMPLTGIGLHNCPKISDLTPLEGMKLEWVNLLTQPTKGMEVIRRMKTLTQINGVNPTQFWQQWDAAQAKPK